MGQYIIIGIRMVFFVLLQGLILNNVDLFGFVTPYLYVLVILLFPIEANPSLVLGLSFMLGMGVDMFSHTWGMHASASVFLAFARPYLLSLMAPRDGFPSGTPPDMSHMGINWFLVYALIMITCHHLFLFFVEVFRVSEFFYTLGRALASVAFTYLLVLIAQFLTFKQRRVL
ncbi:MAG: rod shape-determining protein MreD [Crocinitomicaceae bacterium]|nr:rod shape-determining protein MreD [Crocinitomicaceae bacterium]|tara:strand:- start:6914 stop:7429 length:516 start_codon:yes stop_codon:yes gene_type:complete